MAGSFQEELGCTADWLPECELTQLSLDEDDGVWQASFDLPAGNWEYKAALNGTWVENYGLGGERDGANIALALEAPATVKFFYDDVTHWVTDNRSSVIATAPGSFQSELGCAADWDPGCLRSWLQDADGDGVAQLSTSSLPPGDYEFKVAIDEGWAENYGLDGAPDGPNIPFTVEAARDVVVLSYDVEHPRAQRQRDPRRARGRRGARPRARSPPRSSTRSSTSRSPTASTTATEPTTAVTTRGPAVPTAGRRRS